MNLRHILFILVYFILTRISSISTSEIIDLEKNESQIELIPLNVATEDNNIPNIQENEIASSNDAITNQASEQPAVEVADVVIDDTVEKDIKFEAEEVEEPHANDDEDINNAEVIQENLTIPVFSEWTQQQMQEAEKKLVELTGNSTETNKEYIKNETLTKLQIVKMRQKNYALPDCGAKILASNPEAQSASSVLSDKDEYMLSPCTDRIWFVVELCDSIQAQRVELANFELFSSPLKSVSISVSNRFPTREWTVAGHFDAKSERDVQIFDLKDVTLFGKFVRVDLQYTNTEHYCPLSFFRIFGTSEIEAFEVENEPDDRHNHIEDDDDYIHNQNQNRVENNKDNILNRAWSIVQKAAEVLVKSNGNGAKPNATSSKQFKDSCISLSHNILCEVCSSDERLNLHNFIACKNPALTNLLEKEMKDYLMNSNICNSILGFNLKSESIETNKNFIASILPQKYIAAMCNYIACDQKSLSLHVEEMTEIAKNLISKKDEVSLKNISKKDNEDECNHNNETIQTEVVSSDNESLNASAESKEEKLNIEESSNNKSTSGDEKNIFNHIERQQPYLESQNEENLSAETNDNNIETTIEPEKVVSHPAETEETPPSPSLKIDSQPSKIASNSEIRNSQNSIKINDVDSKIVNELKNNQTIEIKPNSEQRIASSTNAPESVFLRLSNRIKILEKNMTLSTQYLEELSRKYKKQIEDLQQAYSKLQILYDTLNQSKKESEKRYLEDKKQIKKDFDEISKKSNYMEIVLFIVAAFLLLQTILIIVLFKRMLILKDLFVSNENRNLISSGVTENQSTPPNEKTSTRTTNRKRSKQRVRKISAPNILSRQNGSNINNNHNNVNNLVSLNRTVSAPHKVNEFEFADINGELKQPTMLEENDEILIPTFEGLKINDDEDENAVNDEPKRAKQNDLVATSSIKNLSADEDKISNGSSFTRRLSSPTTFLKLKKTTSMKVKNGRMNQHHNHHKKAKSESPPNINSSSNKNFIQKSHSFHTDDEKISSDYDGSFKFRKNNSFKKLFKKLF